MRNLIIGISVLFVAIIAVSYFYFSDLAEKDAADQASGILGETEAVSTEQNANDGALWTFDLNGGAINSPSVHRDTDNTYFILVQDAYHIIHAISPDGRKLWNAQLPGPIIDRIVQLSDYSLVFTTAERLYRIDTEGDPLPGFSLQLPQRATRGAVVIRQPEDGPARIQVGTGKHNLAYDGRGNLLGRETHSQDAETNESDLDEAALPHGCGPLAYAGPLYNDGQRYLLCSKDDRKLYCFRY